MKKLIIFLFLFSGIQIKAQNPEPQLVMQGWYWDYPKTANGAQWTDTLSNKAADLANAGFTHIWFPPHAVASSGTVSNGYDPRDLFIGNETTGLGTRPSLDNMMQTFSANGIKPVADLIYNHRDGGAWENNPAVTEYLFDSCCGTQNGGNPFPNDRYRLILPIGGSTGINAGDLYFKFSSKSGNYGNNGYKIYMYTNKTNTYNPAPINESEPNGGGDCGQGFNVTQLATDFLGQIDSNGCSVDELKLTLTNDDFNSASDTLFIEVRNNNSGYHDFRPYGIWSTSTNADVSNQLVAQTLTDFSNMPSGKGEIHWDAFRPNNTNASVEKLDGDWNSMIFFYDYDQFQPQTINLLNEWTEWNYDELGVRGIRMDAIKHFTPTYVSNMINYMVSKNKAPDYVVGEWFDINRGAQKNWIDQVVNELTPAARTEVQPKVFDFSLRESLRSACDSYGYDARDIYDNSLNAYGVSGFNISTFVNNHDFRQLNTGYESLIINDPILAYAYILTNNQIGVPVVFYPDYYGYPKNGYSWHPTEQTPLENEINNLWAVHKKYIANADNHTYLNSKNGGNTFDDNANYISGASSNSLIYQIGNTTLGKSIIVAINFSGNDLKVDHQINTFNGGIPQGTIFTDVLENSRFNQATVNNQNRIYIDLPPRSYSVWVQGEVCPIPKKVNTQQGTYTATYECEEDGWTNYYADGADKHEILFSIKKENSGVTVAPNNVSVGVNTGTQAIDLSTASYVTNPNGWWVSRRYWDITATTQPNQPIKVRSYFTEEDLTELKNSPGFYNQLSDLVLYKISGSENPDPATGHIAVTPTNYTEIISPNFEIQKINNNYYAEFEINSFSGGGVGVLGSAPLPIELVYFSAEAENRDTQLRWQTASETNNDYFVISRSKNGIDFEQIALIRGQENSDNFTNYSLIDKEAAGYAQKIYYLLHQVDLDGTTTSHPIRLVNFSNVEIQTKLFPNPINSGQEITIQAQEIQQINLYDSFGRNIRQWNINGQRSTSISTKGLHQGVYFIQINTGELLKFVIQ